MRSITFILKHQSIQTRVTTTTYWLVVYAMRQLLSLIETLFIYTFKNFIGSTWHCYLVKISCRITHTSTQRNIKAGKKTRWVTCQAQRHAHDYWGEDEVEGGDLKHIAVRVWIHVNIFVLSRHTQGLGTTIPTVSLLRQRHQRDTFKTENMKAELTISQSQSVCQKCC